MGVTTPEMIQRAKTLRKNLTESEKILWNYLTEHKIGDTKWRRQHPINDYIVDFCSIEKMIAIEVDGGYHNTPEQQASDKVKDEYLESLGFRILRFTNEDITNNMISVISDIQQQCDIPYPDDHRKEGRGLGEGIQHTGIGTQVMTIAEQIAQHAQHHKISVIAGVGVREYYRNKLGYHLEGTYMVKEL